MPTTMPTIEVATAWELLRIGVGVGFGCGLTIHLLIQAARGWGWVDKAFSKGK